MDLVHERAAGIDISKRDAKVAIGVPGKRAGSFTTSVTTPVTPPPMTKRWATWPGSPGSTQYSAVFPTGGRIESARLAAPCPAGSASA
ncbi:hypothetical protein [Brevibacterium aurantiacum]|uniref:hypothetical protein n=1 Tax=Brevibacterium aurantiacum TaxID=273384 RepID=UPI0021B21499|nr:hypothetical protein [Brevibacterium aurantiacum]